MDRGTELPFLCAQSRRSGGSGGRNAGKTRDEASPFPGKPGLQNLAFRDRTERCARLAAVKEQISKRRGCVDQMGKDAYMDWVGEEHYREYYEKQLAETDPE